MNSTIKRVRPERMAWLAGGILLGLYVLAQLVDAFLVTTVSVRLGGLGLGAFAAAMVVFALGVRKLGSIVDRRPIGVASLLVLGFWPVLTSIVYAFLPLEGLAADSGALTMLNVLANVNQVILLVAGVLAVVTIIRAGVLPRPYRFFPAWAFGLVVALQVMAAIAAVTVPPSQSGVLSSFLALGGLLTFLASAALATMAIVLGLQPSRPAVEIYRSRS